MKKTLLLLILLISAATAVAQSTTRTISGAVIDKNGNPLPNALVEATGGAESVTTDADGSFTIEVPIWLKALTARYAGLPDKTIKVIGRNNILFELKPKTGGWFLNAAYSLNWAHYASNFNRVGVMGGYLGPWGGYAKLMFAVDTENATPNVTVGGIRHIYGPAYLYVGAGYASAEMYDNYYEWDYEPAYMVEGGVILKFNRVNFSIGYSYSDSPDFSDYNNHSAQFTIGYCF